MFAVGEGGAMKKEKENALLTIDIHIWFRGKVYALRFTRLLKYLIPVAALIIRYYLRSREVP